MIGLMALHSLVMCTLSDRLGLGYHSPLWRLYLSMQELLGYLLTILSSTLIQAFQHYCHIQPSWHNNSFSTLMTNFLIMSEAIGYSEFTGELHSIGGSTVYMPAACLAVRLLELMSLCLDFVS